MIAEQALQLWDGSRSEGLPSSDCTSVNFERLLHLELSAGEDRSTSDPMLRLLVHFVVGAHGYSSTRPGKRRAPSAGARYPVECLVLKWHEGEPQLLMVSLARCSVLRMSDALAAQVVRAVGAEPGEACIVVVASLWKTIERYGLAGVRYTVYDAGHVLSNLSEFALDEGQRLGLDLSTDTRCVFKELSGNIIALYAVRMACRPDALDAEAELHWPEQAPAGLPAHIDPPSFSPLLVRARSLFAAMAREVGGRDLPMCSLTRERRRSLGTDWVEARRSVKGFSRPGPLEPAAAGHLQPFLGRLLQHAREAYSLQLGMACFLRQDDGSYALGQALSLRDGRPVPVHSAEAFADACNGQSQVANAAAIAVLFVQLSHLDTAQRLQANAASQNCIGILSSEIYRYCAISGIGTTMLCGFSSEKINALLAGNADWPLALQLFGREDAAGIKSDTNYLQ